MPELRSFALAAAAALVLPAAAAAQALDRSGLHEVDDDRTDVTYQGLTVDQLDDMKVARNGEEIGGIEEVLASDRNEIVAVVVEYDDFLDLDDLEVIMPIDRLEFGGDGRQAVTSMSDDELRALTVWDD